MKPTNPSVLATRRYLVEFTIAMIAYVAILFPCIYALQRGVDEPWRAIVAVLPVVPVAGVFVAVLRYIGAIDELERQIHIEALAVSAGATALLAVTYALLENAGLPKISGWWTFMSIAIGMGLAKPFIARRYR